MGELINIYNTQDNKYQRALDLYITLSDEKEKAHQWLRGCVEKLTSRSLFVDAGAGEGGTTAFLSNWFEQVIAIEPSQSLRAELKKKCPDIEVLPDKISDALLPYDSADMVLCSHVLYYIPHDQWMANLKKMASWVSESGILVVMLAHYERSEFSKLYDHFYQRQFNLDKLAESFQSQYNDQYEVNMETVPATFKTDSFDAAYTIAEWILNDFPGSDIPHRRDLKAYVYTRFSLPEGGFYCACDQSFLQIRRR